MYGSLTPRAALEEALAHYRYFGIPVHAAMPRMFVALEFDLCSVLDLTDGAVRRSMGISEKRLLECDWRAEAQVGKTPLTHEVGHAAHLVGLEGMLVRSAVDGSGRNLVVFVENLQPGSTLKVVGANQLPKD